MYDSVHSPNFSASGDPPEAATGFPISSLNQSNYTKDPPLLQGPFPWSTGLCGCLEDVPNCCLTCWCPCITFGRVAEILDKGSSSCAFNGMLYTLMCWLTGCCCCYSCFYRSMLRRKYSLEDSPCSDCLVHCCCELCAICQEYRELKSRGFDMTIGWQGNWEKQNLGIEMVPPVEGGMER